MFARLTLSKQRLISGILVCMLLIKLCLSMFVILNSNHPQGLLAWCNPKAFSTLLSSNSLNQKVLNQQQPPSIKFANKNLFTQNDQHSSFAIDHDCPWCLGQGTHHPGVASLPLLPQVFIPKRCFGIDYADVALVDSLLGWFASLSHPPPTIFS